MPTPDTESDFVPVVSVTGELIPAQWAAVSAKVGGRVVEIPVEPGAEVNAGDAILRLDTTDLELALQVAQQEVIAQQAALDQLLAGTTERTIARADRENAQQIQQAEIVLRIKERQLAQAQVQDPAKDVAAARTQIEQFEAQLTQAQAQNPAPQVNLAEIELERAKIALEDIQDEYNKALDRPWEKQKVRDAWAKELEQAQLNYRAAQAQLDAAQSTARAHTSGLTALQAQIKTAKIRLEQALGAQAAYATGLSILTDEVQGARLALEHLRAWENPYRDPVRTQEIEQSEARLDQARGSVAQIEQQIQDATARAPFDGTIGLVSMRVGEQIGPGQPLATLGNLDSLRVETTDLDEIDVVRVEVGQKAAVVFDALPDRVFEGSVTRISPMAEPGSGGVHYSVVIDLVEIDPALRWGMTAFVDVEVGDD
jgi:HlyD family secretion protein